MRKLFGLVMLVAALAVAPFAQAQGIGLNAADFGNWQFESLSATAAGAGVTMTVKGFPTAVSTGGVQFLPISTSIPLVIDEGLAAAETITPSAVSCSLGSFENSCTFTATFGNAHPAGARIRSGTFGLCEAIRSTRGTAPVIVGAGFRGSTSTITSSTLGGACDSASVAVLDFRSGFTTYVSNGTVYAGGGGTVNGATVSAVDQGSGAVHTTVITLTATPLSVVNGTEYQGVKVFDFPEGRILILGATAAIAETTTSAIASTINETSDFDWSFGTATASSVTLATTMVDIVPKVDGASSATINVAAATSTGALAASAQFDGTGTAKDIYLNTAFPTTTDVDGNGTITISGTLTVTWVNLGDF